MIDWILGMIIVGIFVMIVRNKHRGYTWIARNGEKLTMKQFFKRWGQGIEGITPLAQTKTTLWSFPLVVGGIITGIIIMFFNHQWWLLVLLCGSLPITLMQVVGVYQKYRILKKVDDTIKQIENGMETERQEN